MIENPFNPGYLGSEQLIDLGFGKVGKNVRIAKSTTIIGLNNIFFGDDIRIDGYTTIVANGGGRLLVGSNVHIGAYCLLSCGEDVALADFSGLSQGVRIYTRTDDYSGRTLTNPTVPAKFTGVRSGKVFLGRHVIIGSGTVVLPGVSIGEGAAVGALSLVTKNLDEWGVFFGSPAKKIKNRARTLLSLEEEYLRERDCLAEQYS